MRRMWVRLKLGMARNFLTAACRWLKLLMGSFSLTPRTSHKISLLTLPPAQADFMAYAQMLTATKVFTTAVTTAAWKVKPSWYMVAKADKTINPDLERMYAERAHSHKVEAEGASHAVYISHAKEVAALIEDAAGQARVAGSH